MSQASRDLPINYDIPSTPLGKKLGQSIAARVHDAMLRQGEEIEEQLMQLAASYPEGTDMRMHLAIEHQDKKTYILKDGVRVVCVELEL